MHFTTEKVYFITDDLIVQHFVEINGELRKVLAVYKMRGSQHSNDLRTYVSREALATRIGWPPADLTQALARLQALGYASLTEDDQGTYRAVAQVGG